MVILNLAVLAPNDALSIIGGFKFGGMVRYRHMYMYMDAHSRKLADFSLAL